MKRYPWFVPTVIFTIFVVAGGITHPLWYDETESADFARQIIRTGLPMGWDGVNIISGHNGMLLNDHLINNASPWPQFYLTALGLWLFGQSPFAARLPFIVIAIMCIPLTYLVALTLTQNRRIAVIASWILALSVPFILFGYQSRYYLVVVFADLIFAWAAITIGRGLKQKILFILSGIISVYFQSVSFFLFFIALGCALFVRDRLLHKSSGTVRRYMTLGAPVWFAFAPWLVFMHPFSGRGQIIILSLSDFILNAGRFIVNAFEPYAIGNIFPVSFLLLAVWYMWIRRDDRNGVGILAFLLTVPIVALAISVVFSLFTISDSVFIENRYHTILYPFFALTDAILINEIWMRNRWAGRIALIVLLFTSLWSLAPESLLWKYLTEVSHPVRSQDQVVAAYLDGHAKDGETAFVSLDRDHEPLLFYLNKKLRFVNRLDRNNMRLLKPNRAILPKYVYAFSDNPDWLIYYSLRNPEGTYEMFDYRAIAPTLPIELNLKRDYVLETVIPMYFTDESRPEIDLHAFVPKVPGPTDQIFIYHRKKSISV